MLERPEKRALDDQTELHVIGFVIENSSVYLSEVYYMIHDITGETVSHSTICRLLKQYGFSRKKIRVGKKNENPANRRLVPLMR